MPIVTCPDSGATFMGAALEQIAIDTKAECIENSATQKGDWRPILILLTDGKPAI